MTTPHSSNPSPFHVTEVNTATAEPMSGDADKFPGDCDSWVLTAKQAEEFFLLSAQIDARTYHHVYDTSRCMISGKVQMEGKSWGFKINGGAKAILIRGDNVRYFGCRVASCEPLIVFMQDDAR